ncbi:ribonuclease J [Candidatus Peregrinibacteria bacterium]|nr:ribonuclease J [Candidatus Peregrinibacteria bacterium]
MEKDDNLSQWLKKTLLPQGKVVPEQAPQEKKDPDDTSVPDQNRPKGRHFGHVREEARHEAQISTQGVPEKKPTHFLKKITHRVAPQTLPPKGHGTFRIIPLGGLEEVGKNMMVLEYIPAGHKESSDIIIIDMGFQFPEEDMLGVDYVIPDTNYLQGKTHKIRGVFITHGHLDHIGGIPYLYNKLGGPEFYGTRLTMGLVRKRLEEFDLDRTARLHTIDYDDVIQLGYFQVELFRVNHSIPDAAGVIVRTPAGTIAHTGDFKFDFTPPDSKPADFAKMARLGVQNVTALFSDSTNATKPGYTVSEKTVGITLSDMIKNIPGRIIIAVFSSSLGRIQQIIQAAIQYDRKVYLSGRSIVDNVGIAMELGYIKVPPGTVKDIRKASPKMVGGDDAVILTTGSQGEALSALSRMAMKDHAQIILKKGDTVVFSSSPIIGNERAITTVINNLCQMGVKTISNAVMDVHASGHGCQEDLKLMMNLVRPKYMVPIHGELYMRTAHAQLAQSIGYGEKHTIIANNGTILEIVNHELRVLEEKVDTNYIMVDGLGVGNVGAQVLMERQIMAGNGVLVVIFNVDSHSKKLKSIPDVISRGFIYMKESQELIGAVTEEAKKAYQDIISRDARAKRGDVKNYIRSRLDRFVHKKIEKTPLILPVIVTV